MVVLLLPLFCWIDLRQELAEVEGRIRLISDHIDRSVDRLDGLTEDEIEMVEEALGRRLVGRATLSVPMRLKEWGIL
jgi:hypothetical protein